MFVFVVSIVICTAHTFFVWIVALVFISLLSMMFEILESCRVLRLGTPSKKIIIIIIKQTKKNNEK